VARKPNLTLAVLLLLVAATCTSCAAYRWFRESVTNPEFQAIVGAISEVCGPQYGAVARLFFRTVNAGFGCSVYSAQNRPQVAELKAGPPKPGELRLEFDVLKEVVVQGRSCAFPVKDGDSLTHKDNFRVFFRANQSCHVYVVLLGTTGKLQPIFPRSQWTTGSNPVAANKDYFIPHDEWFFLDKNTGTEYVYVLASKNAKPDLEKALDELNRANQTVQPTGPMPLKEPVILTRDIEGKRPSQEPRVTTMPDGKTSAVFQPFLFAAKAGELLETRWFYHK